MIEDKKQYVGRFYKGAGVYQLMNLIKVGLKPDNKVLDFGCGSLRFGMYAIVFLDKNNYFGIEPKKELVDFGIKENNLKEIIDFKNPCFHFSASCDMDFFNKSFDFVIAQSVFTHMSTKDIIKSFSQAYSVLKPGGVFLFTIRNGKNDLVDCWVQDRVARKNPKWMRKVAYDCCFKDFVSRPDLMHWNNQHWYMTKK